MTKDKILENIYSDFDHADKIFRNDLSINFHEDLYYSIEKRLKSQELSREQMIAILERSLKSQELFLEMKKQQLQKMMENTENTKNISKYIKNSHLLKT